MKLRQVLFSFLLFIALSAMASAVPTSWAVTGNTGNYSNIGFSQSGTYTINGRAMAAGDAIGVFFTRGTDQICAGYLVWGNAQFGFSAWGDNTQTPVKDGFAENESYVFKLWDNALQIEISDPNMSLNTGFGIYTTNGMTTYNAFSGQNLGNLGIPILVSPANEAVDIVRSPTYSFQGVSTATSYELKVSTNPAFTAPGDAFTGSLSTTSYSVGPNQLPGAIYYWKVRAYRAGDGTYSDWSEVRSFQIVHVVPAVPILNQPENAIVGVMSPILLTWQSAIDALRYQVQVSTSSAFTTLAAEKLTDDYMTSTGIANLTANTLYYWRVKSVNTTRESDWSTVRQFTTALGTLTSPSLTAPADYATDQSTDITLTWNAVTDATAYRVQLSTSNTFGSYLSNELVTNTQFTKTGLNGNTYHYWRVRAERGAEYGAWTTRRFTTGTTALITAPTLSTPANNATGLIPCVTISWNSVATATAYYMQIATDNAFSNLVNQGVISTTSHTQNLLAFSQTYYWRVKTKRGDTEESAWSDIRSFTTMPALAIPTLSAPANNAVNSPITQNISWNAVPNAEYYEIHLSTFANFASYSTLSTANTNYDLTQLSNSTKFYWRVRAVRALDCYGNERTNWSSVYNFTTVPPPPAAPVLVAPANQAVNVSVDPTFSWNAVVGQGVNYKIQVSTASDFSTITVTDVQSDLTRTFIGLAAGTTYYWRVQAIENDQFGDWSETRSFTTAGQTAPTITTLNVDVLLQGFWNNTTHKQVAVTVELRTGNSLSSSILYKRVPVLISSNGVATAEFDDFTTGDYWIIVRSAGYLSISSKLRQTITAGSPNNYDFTRSTNNVYSSGMLRIYSGRYIMKIGDLNNNKSIDGSDGILIENNTGGSTAVPSL